jgi:hypothetical protein
VEALQDFPAFLQFAPPLRNLLFAERDDVVYWYLIQ